MRVGGVHGGGERGEEGVEDRQRDADRVREHGRQSGSHGRRKRVHGVSHGRRPRPRPGALAVRGGWILFFSPNLVGLGEESGRVGGMEME